jgi:hypothetical protein
MTVELINNQALLIIEKQKKYDDYKKNTIIKGEQNHLYKVDKEDKKLFKENDNEIERDKFELEKLIKNYLLNIYII